MNQTRATIILIVTLVVLGGVAWLLVHKDTGELDNLSLSTTTDSIDTTPSTVPDDLHFSARTLKRDNDRYSINLSYPHADSDTAVALSINRQLESFVAEQVNTFQSQLGDPVTDPKITVPILPGSLSSTYEINPQVITGVAGISIFTTYDTGGAHPGHAYATFNFDTTTGALISLTNLFRPDSNYLNQLSTIAREMLTAKLGNLSDAEFINGGTTPQAQNFSEFLLTNQGLEIIFNEYQVAAYAAGPQKITIPYSKLALLLDPAGPLAVYAQ
jgi:hypothetical protein